MEKLISRNPATGEPLVELPATPLDSLPSVFATARRAQREWATLSVKKRCNVLLQLRETLLNRADDVIEVLSKENGKPAAEALMNEVVPSVDTLSFFARQAPRMLRDKKIPMRLMKHRSSYINYWPMGVVVVISPWNYPLLLPFGDIVMALASGNAVIFKPSEITPLIGMRIQQLCDECGFPPGLVQTVLGDGSLGAALIQQKPDKIFFTGSVATGKRVAMAAAEHLIPVNLELGGKDAMLVLADANLDYATSAALWGAFSNSGQVCASTERILVHEKIAEPFVSLLKEKIASLRASDLGSITMEKQKSVYEAHIREAKERGARFVTGGEFSADRTRLQPTLVTGPEIENLLIYNEETFGPVVAVSTFKSLAEGIEKANRGRYGLLASVITRNSSLGEEVARKLEVGTAIVNEVTYTAGLGETPWGGIKESGIGRTHSEMGLLEFVNVRHIHKPRFGFYFKSLWWFPYTPYQYATFRQFIELYRRSRWDRLRAFPHVLWNLVQFLKKEKRT